MFFHSFLYFVLHFMCIVFRAQKYTFSPFLSFLPLQYKVLDKDITLKHILTSTSKQSLDITVTSRYIDALARIGCKHNGTCISYYFSLYIVLSVSEDKQIFSRL